MASQEFYSADVNVKPKYASSGVEMRLPPIVTQEEPSALHEPQSRNRNDINRVLQAYIPLDIFALIAGFFVAWAIATAVNYAFYGREFLQSFSDFAPVKLAEFAVISSGVVLWFQHTGHYRIRMPFWSETKGVAIALSFAMMMDSFLQFTTKQDFSRLCLVSAWLISSVIIITLRGVLRSYLRRKGLWKIRTLLVGDGITAEEASAALGSESGLGYEIVAQARNLLSEFMLAGRSWDMLCSRHGADYVIIALDGRDLANAQQPIAQLMREQIPFSVSPPLHHLPVHGMIPQYFFNHDVMLFTRTCGLEKPLPRILKRVFDLLVSGLAVLALSPVFLVIATLVRLDGGSALYGHTRVGRNGKKFDCLKFRSMIHGNSEKILNDYLANNPGALAEWKETQKLKDDPRVTRIGKILRKLSLDELPQFFNILKGDMSLVGPRPIVTAEVQKYHSDIAYYYRVRPGITGMWQVSGRNDVSYTQRVQMDSWYVRNWSLWHDIAIICKTFPALMQRSGAY